MRKNVSHEQRRGITAGGNWIVDRVKTVDRLPGRGMLANIISESTSTGGAPGNVLGDLARLQTPFPLAGVGVVGRDADGQLILDTFGRLGIDVRHLVQTDKAPTSYTDVMNEAGSGDRTFFHNRGANRLFGPEHIPVDELSCRIFHLGYLLLLDRMDEKDSNVGTVAAAALHRLREAGIRTSLDLVSEDSDRFKVIVPPALRHVDYLILNEIEAGRTVGCEVRNQDGGLVGEAVAASAAKLQSLGSMELVAIHMPEGVYVRDRQGQQWSLGALQLPDGFIKGTVGAGDAFCAGMLYGLHEAWSPEASARLAICCAAASLSSYGASEGVRPLGEVLKLAEQFPERDPPVAV